MATLTITKKDGTEVEVKAEGVQVPPATHGSFSLGGVPIMAPGVNLAESINPATGSAYIQVGAKAPSQIQAPPQNFSRRRG